VCHSDPQIGSKHDFNTFRSRIELYKQVTLKTDEEKIATEEVDEHPYWGILADLGYQGEVGELRVITPIKDQNKHIGVEQKNNVEEHNKNLAKTRVIIERLFGVMKEIFPRMNYYTGGDNLKIDIENVLLLLNVYMTQHPLTPENGAMNARFISFNLRTSDLAKEKKRLAQKRYREKVKNRITDLDAYARYIEGENSAFPLDNIDEGEIEEFHNGSENVTRRSSELISISSDEDRENNEKISGYQHNRKILRNNDGDNISPQEKNDSNLEENPSEFQSDVSEPQPDKEN
jgi:hypothetical protein